MLQKQKEIITDKLENRTEQNRYVLIQKKKLFKFLENFQNKYMVFTDFRKIVF